MFFMCRHYVSFRWLDDARAVKKITTVPRATLIFMVNLNISYNYGHKDIFT